MLLGAWNYDKDYQSFAQLRLAQTNLSAMVDNTFLISALDQGDPQSGSVHSPYKQEVGRRAALGITAVYHQMQVSYAGPRYRSATELPNVGVAVTFGEGLYGKSIGLNSTPVCPSGFSGNNCEAFAILSAPDCLWHSATATLHDKDNTILLTPQGWTNGTRAAATRAYFANWPLVQVRNADGIPAEPWQEFIDSSVSRECPNFGPVDTTTTTTGEPCDPSNPDIEAPAGFVAMFEQGWWSDFTQASLGGHGTVAGCAAQCHELGRVCAGFHVWKPCAVGDCYLYLHGIGGFASHTGAYAYRRSEAQPIQGSVRLV